MSVRWTLLPKGPLEFCFLSATAEHFSWEAAPLDSGASRRMTAIVAGTTRWLASGSGLILK